MKSTLYAVAKACEEQPEVVTRCVEMGHDVASHADRWRDHSNLSVEAEKQHIREGITSVNKLSDYAPHGWYYGRVRGGSGGEATLSKAADLLRNHGAEVTEISLPTALDDLPKSHATVLPSDGRTAFLPEYTVDRSQISSQLVGHVENTEKITRKAQLEAFDKVAAARPVVNEILGKYVAVITPSVPDSAPEGIGGTGSAAFCTTWTALHTPVVNVPGFAGCHGMPIGASLVAPRYHDRRLLAVSKSVGQVSEAEGGWKSSL